MGRSIKLREDSHTPKTRLSLGGEKSPETCIFHDVPDVLRGVHLPRAVRSMHRELRHPSGVEWEAVGVGDVPVEHVQLVVRHPGYDLLDNLRQEG